jgi:hypothetical protein
MVCQFLSLPAARPDATVTFCQLQQVEAHHFRHFINFFKACEGQKSIGYEQKATNTYLMNNKTKFLH